MPALRQPTASPLYAVIDLGSNSFHMLITRLVADSVQTVDKVKRKVRLASGLNANNELSPRAMSRGLECLSFFAERLQDIHPKNICIVATATLRIAKNADVFLQKAENILGQKITLLSGLEEAERIYLGVAHTSESSGKRLVIDIGGASTEIIAGNNFDITQAHSLNMGCVTFNEQYFSDGLINQENFDQATNAALQLLSPIIDDYKTIGWHDVLGGSGTMQALAEILVFQHKPAIITAKFLATLRKTLINCGSINKIKIAGLQSDRAPVITSGLAILIAIFKSLNIKSLQLSSGALREGLLYEMLPDMRKISIRTRTINSISQRFHIDLQHANRVQQQAEHLYYQHTKEWGISNDNLLALLKASCALHEVGLLLSFKYHQQHGAYILTHTDLPGFNQTERQLIVTLVNLYKGDIDVEQLKNVSATNFDTACHLLIILRLAAVLCRRRQDDVLPDYKTEVSDNTIALCLPQAWLDDHPLIADELLQENQHLNKISYQLTIQC